MEDWTNKVVFITGGANGIGKGMAKAFLELGANVIISDINEEAMIRTRQELTSTDRPEQTLETIKMDITNESEVSNAINDTINQHQKIDVFINSAGLQYVSMIEDYPTETFEKLWRIMCFGPFLTMKYILPHMKKQNYGRIIHLASINGLVGFAGKSAYNSAKHGVIGLTKVAALETADTGITVNALCPGYVDTDLVRNQLGDLAKTRGVTVEKVKEEILYPLIPQKRILQIEEVVDYAIFLAGEKARGVTGQAVVLDGGYTVQ